ncbi:hypothetical protein HY483_01590 [Candidatus Woesearchaeota archaeon]|nr:hypothetical protein [Candidatus Woesearchaeota archaeon]
MGIFGRLFKKENSEEEFMGSTDAFLGSDESSKITGLPSMDERAKDLHPLPGFDEKPAPSFASPGSAPIPSYGQAIPTTGQQTQASMDSKDVQIITAKIDLLKASIDTLSEKVARLEKMVEERTNVFRGRF